MTVPTLESFYEPIAQSMATHTCILMRRVLARGTMIAYAQPAIVFQVGRPAPSVIS